MKDKDEVGRMKGEIGSDQLLQGLPPELTDFVRHLESLAYPDTPDYDFLAKCLKNIVQR